MKRGGKGGGNTKVGINFEKEGGLLKWFEGKPNYQFLQKKGIEGLFLLYKDEEIGRCFRQARFYNFLRDEHNIIGRDLLP
jgi:hypothetical protein